MKIKHFLAFALAVTLSLAFFAGCGNTPSPIDPKKTQLYVGVYNGGLGYEWMQEAGKKFETICGETSFEDGKNGVQVMLVPKKLQYEPGTLLPSLQTGIETSDLYFTASSTSAAWQYLDGGVTADIAPYLTEKVYTAAGVYGGNEKSLLDRLIPEYKNLYKYTAQGGGDAYYGIPFEDTITGFIYDHDLFMERGYTVPETFQDFKNLFGDMVNDNITPFTYTGANSFYAIPLTTAVAAQVDGVAQSDLNVTYSGTLTSAVSPSNNGVEITPENGYLLADQKGKLTALEFLKFLVSDSRFYTQATFGQSQSHMDAQREFVYSKKVGSKRVAMIIEGEWWENEAREFFTEMETQYRDPNLGYGKRDFRYMPLPAFEDQASEKSVFSGFGLGTIAFMNKNSVKKDLAGKFLQYVYSQEGASIFTTKTGEQLAVDYSLTSGQLSSMTKFAQDLWQVKRGGDAIIYRPVNFSGYAKFGTLKMGGAGGELISTIGTTTYREALASFYQSSGLTVQAYFNGMKDYYTPGAWKTSYDDFMSL